MSAIVFFVLTSFMMAGYDVAYMETFTGTSECTVANPCVTTRYLVGDGTSQAEARGNSAWIGWLFLLLGIFSALLFFLELIP